MKSIKEFQEKIFSERKSKRMILFSAAAFLVGSFLPWFNAPFHLYNAAYFMNVQGMSGLTLNGWHGWGMVGVLAAVALLAIWGLSRFGNSPNIFSEHSRIIEKLLAAVLLASPLLWFLSTGFSFSMAGIGLWISLLSGGTATYFAFQKQET